MSISSIFRHYLVPDLFQPDPLIWLTCGLSGVTFFWLPRATVSISIGIIVTHVLVT